MNIAVAQSGGPTCAINASLLGVFRHATKFEEIEKSNNNFLKGLSISGYEIDFDEAMSRSRMYSDFERHEYENTCNLFKKA